MANNDKVHFNVNFVDDVMVIFIALLSSDTCKAFGAY